MFQSHYIAHCELAPYVPSPTEGRQVVERFAKAQECATTQPVNEPLSQGVRLLRNAALV